MATPEELAEHNGVFYEALETYERRDGHHEGLWKTMDVEEETQLISHKAKRWAHTHHEDDALDLINYVVFSIRNERRREEERAEMKEGRE